MGDQPNKKRRADVDLDQDNWQNEDNEASGKVADEPFVPADEATLAQRKKVKVVRDPATGAAVQKTANPFAGVSIISGSADAAKRAPPAGNQEPTEDGTPAKADDAAGKAVKDDEAKVAGQSAEKDAEAGQPGTAMGPAAGGAGAGAAADKPDTPAGGFGALAAGSSVSGFKFGGSSFGSTFSSAASGSLFSGFGAMNGTSIFGGKPGGAVASSTSDAAPADFTFTKPFGGAFGGTHSSGESAQPGQQSPGAGNGTVPLFGSAAAPGAKEAPDANVLGNQRPATGEEEESTIFTTDAVLFMFDAPAKQWKERGKGVLRMNLMPDGKCRLVMRQKGILRVLLNAALYPEMTLKLMEGGKGVSFLCLNAAKDAPHEADAPEEMDKAEASEKQGDADGESGVAEGTGVRAPEARVEAPKAAEMVMHALRIRPADALSTFIRLVEERKHTGASKQAGAN